MQVAFGYFKSELIFKKPGVAVQKASRKENSKLYQKQAKNAFVKHPIFFEIYLHHGVQSPCAPTNLVELIQGGCSVRIRAKVCPHHHDSSRFSKNPG